MKKILNIAHRGFSARFPENTMLAFDEGLRAGADGFECDLRLTSDGHVVVFHDDSLQRLCGVKGSIETSTLAELRTLKVMKQESIPTLEELISTFSTTRMNLEIKKSSRDAIVTEQVLRQLSKHRPQAEVLISSFSLEVLKSLEVMDSDKLLGRHGMLVSTSDMASLPELSKSIKVDTWNTPKQVLSKPWNKRWKGVFVPPLWVWTVDEPHEWALALKSELPIEGVITNEPAAFHSFLNSRCL